MRTNKVGELRPSQMITTFGPGAIMDSLKDSLIILDTNYWPSNGKIIKDSRLGNYLKVYNFMTPQQWQRGIPVISFPDYHVCTNKKCGSLFKLSEKINVNEYQKKGPKCPNCGGSWSAYAARFITYCKDGHMDEFPWMDWIHREEGYSCKGSKLRLYNSKRSSSLDDIIVECGECGKKRSMSQALSEKSFEKYRCTGNHPHRPNESSKACGNQVIPSLRGASNVYFSVIRSAISIPPWINPIDNLLDEHYKMLIEMKKMPMIGDNAYDMIYDQYFKDNYSREDFDSALERKESDIKDYSDIKEMEYSAIINHKDQNIKKIERIFKASEEKVPNYLSQYFSRVIKLERLREVMVLLGFMRDSMPEPDIDMDEKNGMVKLSKHKDNWLPAVENFGEGVFIEFNRDTLEHFFSGKENKIIRENYRDLYDKYLKDKEWTSQSPKDGVYVLMHTFAHVLIKELSDKCGYSSSALKERIYYGENMNGILIYTGTSDSEGSLGGIVEVAKMKNLEEILADGLEKVIDCSSDPICALGTPNTEDNRLVGASCHSCTMIPETACEVGNRFLDRSLLVSLIDTGRSGYFDGLVRELCGIAL
jgi:hypothetical protein